MDDIQKEKEVFFCDYCHKCEFNELSDQKEPCCDCIAQPSNINSHKPVYFKEKETKHA